MSSSSPRPRTRRTTRVRPARVDDELWTALATLPPRQRAVHRPAVLRGPHRGRHRRRPGLLGRHREEPGAQGPDPAACAGDVPRRRRPRRDAVMDPLERELRDVLTSERRTLPASLVPLERVHARGGPATHPSQGRGRCDGPGRGGRRRGPGRPRAGHRARPGTGRGHVPDPDRQRVTPSPAPSGPGPGPDAEATLRHRDEHPDLRRPGRDGGGPCPADLPAAGRVARRRRQTSPRCPCRGSAQAARQQGPAASRHGRPVRQRRRRLAVRRRPVVDPRRRATTGQRSTCPARSYRLEAAAGTAWALVGRVRTRQPAALDARRWASTTGSQVPAVLRRRPGGPHRAGQPGGRARRPGCRGLVQRRRWVRAAARTRAPERCRSG